MRFHIVTLFPAFFDSIFAESVIARARQSGVFSVQFWNPRDFTEDRHGRVDDTPYGGGAGMLMGCQPLFAAIEAAKREAPNAPVFFLTPHGRRFSQPIAEKIAKHFDEIILLCGRYEGVDQRVCDALIDAEISIGDFVLTGGELGAAVVVDAVARLLPDALGNSASAEEESFSAALGRKTEYPHFTKPAEFRGMCVPEVLLSGDHAKIAAWRSENCGKRPKFRFSKAKKSKS